MTPLHISLSRPVLLIILLGSACAPDRTPELEDVREATFRYQFRENASGLQQRAAVYFLALRDPKNGQRLDPSDTLMRRFENHRPRVARASAARTSAVDGVVDKISSERGLIFIVGEVRWLARDRAEVKGGYYEAGESSSGNVYQLRKRNGKWEVVSNRMLWISNVKSSPRAVG